MHLSDEARTHADSDVYPFRHALPSRSARARLNATNTRRSRRQQVSQALKRAARPATGGSARAHELQQAWSCSSRVVEEAPACREQKRARDHVASAFGRCEVCSHGAERAGAGQVKRAHLWQCATSVAGPRFNGRLAALLKVRERSPAARHLVAKAAEKIHGASANRFLRVLVELGSGVERLRRGPLSRHRVSAAELTWVVQFGFRQVARSGAILRPIGPMQ